MTMKPLAGKLRPSLLPPKALEAVVRVLTNGAEKYEPWDWIDRIAEHGTDIYLDAAGRHILAYSGGEGVDQESGLHPLAHAVTSLLFVIETDLGRPRGEVLRDLTGRPVR
jgi:hypothetical protein